MFYDVLTKLCQEQEKSLVQVRKDLGISQSTMASWKARGVTPNAATVARFSEYFDVSVDYLLEKNMEPTSTAARISDEVLQIANILELPLDEQERFDKAYKHFVKTYKVVNSDVHDESIANKLNADEQLGAFFFEVAALCDSIGRMQGINPEGVDRLRIKYKKWSADMDLFSKVYGSLSNDGQREAIKRIQELTQIPVYQRFPTVDEQVEIQTAQEKISKAEQELRLMEQQGVTSGHAVESCRRIISEAQRRVGEITLNRFLEQQ